MTNYNSIKRFNTHRFFLILLISSAIFFNQCQPKKVAGPIDETIVETALDRYVNSPDPNYHYEIAYHEKKEGYTFIVLKMISQKWLTEAEVDEPVWWHWIKIVVPDTIEHETGMMLIGGGAKDDEIPNEPDQVLMQSALLTNSITAEIHNIPNQPLNFKNDNHGPRYEDDLIAYGWRKFLEGGGKEEDAIWLARLPMTKAVVRAMDAVSELVLKENQHTLDKFVVAGGSKRGWTTWTTAAVDDRVVAMAPIVIDMLNLVPSFRHHWRNYGFWAPAVDSYVNEDIMEWMGTPEFERLLKTTEPFEYMERFDIPKLLINATGDQFFQPDSWKFYWDDVIGEKYVRYVPNAGHSLKKSDAVETLVSYYQYILHKKDRPQFDWSVNGSQVNIVTSPQDPPAVIKLWHATSIEEARDFRVDVIGEVWSDSTLTVNPSGKYKIDLPLPANGWKAYFVELTYEQEGMLPLKVTTGVSVFPTEYPFAPFVPNRK